MKENYKLYMVVKFKFRKFFNKLVIVIMCFLNIVLDDI